MTNEQIEAVKLIVKKWDRSGLEYGLNGMFAYHIWSGYKKPELLQMFNDAILIDKNFNKIKHYQQFKNI